MILRFRGGLGNQMFQYAFYRAAQQRGMDIQADITAYEFDKKRKFVLGDFPNVELDYIDREEFNQLFASYCNRGIIQKVINKVLPKTSIYFKELDDSPYDERNFGLKNKIVDGYFQNEQYFVFIRQLLLYELSFPKVKDHAFLSLCEKIKKDSRSVSIHIRRGDYLQLESFYGGICTENYYQNAVQYIEKTRGAANYYVLSDDIEWTKNHIKVEQAVYICSADYTQYEDWYDMYLMSLCHDNIIANSSFSWWGAWLNQHTDKMVIRPQQWNQNSKMEGLCCQGWILL